MISSRRQFIRYPFGELLASVTRRRVRIKFGISTYLQGIPALIHHCQEAGVEGVVLETRLAHGITVRPSITERATVRREFANSDVELVGLGAQWALHHRESAQFAHAISQAKASIILAYDVGAGGIKVELKHPPEEGFPERTISQIGRALQTLGKFAENHGQEIRIQVRGKTPDPVEIMDAANHRNVRMCWNFTPSDLEKQDLPFYSETAREYLAETLHIQELENNTTAYQKLFASLRTLEYVGWILLEIQTAAPSNFAAMLRHQRSLFDILIKP